MAAGTFGSAHAQFYGTEWSGTSVVHLDGLPGSTGSSALSINDVGQVVGESFGPGGVSSAVEWTGGSIVDLGGLPGSTSSSAGGINSIGQVVGVSFGTVGPQTATQWGGGSVIDLGFPPGSTSSAARTVNDVGQVVGDGSGGAIEWTGGSAITLGGVPGSVFTNGGGINDDGQVVGSSDVGGTWYATEWSGGSVTNLGPGFAYAINDAGAVVGLSAGYAAEWSGGSVINLGGLPESTGSEALAINASGQVAGFSIVNDVLYATEWSGGSVINLGGLPESITNPGDLLGTTNSEGYGINDAGQVVGFSWFSPELPPVPIPTPELSTWAMMLLGFAGLSYAGYRRARVPLAA